MPKEKGKTPEEEVSDGLDEGKETPSKPEEETAEGGKDGEKESDELLEKTVKVGNRDIKVSQLMKDHEGLQAEYTKSQQLVKDPERLKAHLKSEFNVDVSEDKTETPTEEGQDDEMKEAVEGGKRAGFLHKDDVTNLIERTKMEIYLENLENTRNLADHFPDLDVSELPAFEKSSIVKYMVEEGFRDPVKAYKDKFDTDIKALEKKANASEKATFTEKPTSGTVKLPPGKSPGKMTDKETSNLMQSMLEGNVKE